MTAYHKQTETYVQHVKIIQPEIKENLINQAQKLMNQLREVDEKEVEEGEALRQLDGNVLDYYDDMLFQDKSTDTSDLAP